MESWGPEILKIGGPLVAALIVLGTIGLKAMGHWKDVRMVEIAERKEEKLAEIAVRKEEAASIGKLSQVFLVSMESTKELELFLRASMRHGDVTERRVSTMETATQQLQDRLTAAIASIQELRGEGRASHERR